MRRSASFDFRAALEAVSWPNIGNVCCFKNGHPTTPLSQSPIAFKKVISICTHHNMGPSLPYLCNHQVATIALLAWTRSPIFTGKGGSMDLECFKNPSHLRFVLTALNCGSWDKFVGKVSALTDAFSIVVYPSSIRDARFNKGSGTDAFCRCLDSRSFW